MSIFDLERDVEIVKRKTEKGLAASKGLTQSRSNGSSNNRLFTLQQRLSPASSSQAGLSSAYATPELTIFNQYYTLAFVAPKPRSGANEQETDPREVLRARMIYLTPMFWKAFDPNAKAKDIPSYNEVWRQLKSAFEGQKVDKKMLYGEKLAEQIKVWEAFLWGARETLFDPKNSERNELQKAFNQLIVEYKKKYNKKEFLPPPVFSFENKKIKTLDQFNTEIHDDKEFVGNFKLKVFEKMHPASLGYAYLEWYEDDDENKEQDPLVANIIPKDVREMYSALSAAVSKSTLTAPKDKVTGKTTQQEYKDAFAKIINVLVKPHKQYGKPITLQQADQWSKDQKEAITKELVGLQAGLGSLHHLLIGGKEVDIGQLKKLALKLNSKADIGGTGLNLVAVANASYDTFSGTAAARIYNISNVDKGVSNYVTDSTWANSGFAPAVITVGGTIHKILTTDWDKLKLTSIAGKGFTSALGLARAGTQAAMFIKDGNKAWGIKPIMASAKVSLDVAGIVTGSIGVVLNAHAAYKELKEVAALFGITGRFEGTVDRSDKLKEHLGVEYHKGISRHRIKNKDYEAFDVILQKMHHRRSYAAVGLYGSIAGLGGATVAIAIKVAAISGAVALGNIWNPVGWAFVIASVVAGLGLISWKGGRKLYKRGQLKRLKKRIVKEGGHIPEFCKTTGDYWRYQAALVIYMSSIAARDIESLKMYPSKALFVIAVGRAFAYILFGDVEKKGKMGDSALDTAFDLGVPGIMAFIKG